MRDYYIFSNGTLQRKENTIYFVDCENNKKALPVEQIDKLHLFGEININSKLLDYLTRYEIILNFYNYYGFYSGSYYPRKSKESGFLIVNQVENYTDYSKRLNIAKKFIESAVHHICRNLRKYKETDIFIKKILKEKELLDNVKKVDELMGVEGRIRNIYYQSFNIILKNFGMGNREKRPPTDPTNTLISFGNSLMYTTVLGEIYKTQLEPTISYLHEPGTKRFSLSLDIAEIFKPLIIDPLIFSLVNNRMITEKCFEMKECFCSLTEEGKKIFVREYDEKLKTTIKHRKLKRNVSYRGFIRLECYKLIKHFIGDEEYNPLKVWW